MSTATPLRVLFVEDSPADVEEVLYLMAVGGFAPTWLRVETAEAMADALGSGEWDVVLSDHHLPRFSSLEALAVLKRSGRDVPFIIVSGVVDDDTAIAAMKSGASDFVKKDRLSRLLPAIEREVAECRNRREADVAKRGLRESEERFRLMVETARDYAIFLLDPAGMVASWNVGAERIFGYSASEVIGLPLCELFPSPNNVEAAAATLAEATATGRFEEEALRRRKDGTTFWAHAIMLALRNPDGTLQGFSRITRDVDDMRRSSEALLQARQDAHELELVRNRLEREKAEVDVERRNLSALFQQTSAIVAILTGPAHTIEFANPAFMRLMGGDSLGRPLIAACPRSPELQAHADRVYATGQTAEFSELAIQTDGDTRFFDFVLSARRNGLGAIDGIMVLATDMTEQLLARKAAEASSASKSAFLANMSHEIRTPLGAILGFSGLLRDANLSALDRDTFIDTINRNGQALTRIIDDILDLAKVEAGRLEVEEINFSLYDLLTEVVELFSEKAKQKGIYLLLTIDEAVPQNIRTDPTRLRQVLFNIIGNAIKFTETGGVRVCVGCKQSDEGAIRMAIDVKDTGCGLNEVQRRRLFQPFTQADNATTRHFGGTGLGLALAKRLCEALGGSVSIGESEPGKGSIFAITFLASPASASIHPASAVRVGDALDGGQRCLEEVAVLVVDDAPDNRVLIKRLLTRSGACVDLASNGREAVEKALSGTYRLVLMDIQMPIMDGYQAVDILRKTGYETPILALTAHAMLEERLRTRAAGFNGHLTKPLNPIELVAAIVAFTAPRDASPSQTNRGAGWYGAEPAATEIH